MGDGRIGGCWPGLRTLIEAGGCAGASDGELLRRFVEGEGEAAGSAFAVLVARHGPMVLRACRAAVGDRHDAEDAFQATFLVLALKARGLVARESVGPWLYRVARHVAARSRARAERRRRHEGMRAASADRVVEAPEEASREVAAILHEEIGRLPAWCRSPVVLCHLEGRTCEEAARALGLPPGTVKSRLSRARVRLRHQLTLRGLAPAVASAALATTSALGASVPSRLAGATARSALDLSRGVTPSIAPRVLVLIREIRRVALMTKLLPIAAGVAAAALVGLGLPGQLPRNVVSAAPSRPARPPIAEEDAGGLVAPRSLAATAGRGEAVLFATNARNERIVDAAKPARPGKPQEVVYKEETRPLRWAVVVGTVDLRATRAAVPGPPRPDSGPFWPAKRIDLERRARRDDGGWSDWAPVDVQANLNILDHLAEVESERVRPEARPEAFVDPLPFLKSGEWRGVDVEAFADKRLDAARVRGLRQQRMPALPPGPAGPPAVADEVMMRSIDFTAQPSATYRYRARVVVDGPAPKHEEMFGPWSEPTGEVTIPKE
jgi:RNA polymerase sigma factor (sigma-70 family)